MVSNELGNAYFREMMSQAATVVGVISRARLWWSSHFTVCGHLLEGWLELLGVAGLARDIRHGCF